jgi:CBS domain-containing protein/ribosome-associated translation inhibitor RaiA
VFGLKGTEIEQMLVKDIMTSSAVTAARDETVADVISKMKKHRLREVPILDGEYPLGLVSYRSLLARRNVPLNARAEQIMAPCPRLEEEMSVTAAAQEMMSSGSRGAPVLRNRKMVGLVSRTDIVKVLSQAAGLKDRSVSTFMTKVPQSVYENDSVRHAQMVMKGLHMDNLPVVDLKDRLIGVVGMPEVLDVIWSPKASKPPNEIIGERNHAEVSVGSVMSRSPVCVSPGDNLGRVSSLMLDRGVSTVFVQEDGRLVGVVSQADLLEQVISLRPKEGVYVQITGLDEDNPEVYEILYSLIQKSMKRIDRIQPPRVFTAHITAYHQEGMKSKYSVRTRLTTDKKMYYSKSNGWDLYKTFDVVLDSLEKSIHREHQKALDQRKKKPSL